MRCPACIQEGKKSRVTDSGTTRTLLSCQPFYDDKGRYHHHDANTRTTGYRCSNGHWFTVKLVGTCTCGWNKDRVPVVDIQVRWEGTTTSVPVHDRAVLEEMFAAGPE